MDILPGYLHNISIDGLRDIDENISAIIYIAGTTEDIINQNEVDIASNVFSRAFQCMFRNDLNVFQNILIEINETSTMFLFKYNVNIADPWLFQVIIINSIKYLDVLLLNSKYISCDQPGSLLFLVNHILNLLDSLKQKSVYLLRTLHLILSRSDLLTYELSLRILKTISLTSLSPITCFKKIAQSVSKIAVNFFSREQIQGIFNPLSLPQQGIEICDILKLYSDDYIKFNIEIVVKKVLRMFLTNIENKDGGFLYGRILICTFDEWKTEIWPLFYKELKHIEYEGEFYQSLVKYWIPSSIAAYRTDFYMFLKDEPIDIILRALILQETLKRGYLLDGVNQYFYNIETANLGLHMITTYHKKSICPQKVHFDMVMHFLYSNMNCCLGDEEVKRMKLFFSHICLYVHNELKKTDMNFIFYKYFIDIVYNFCFVSLNSEFFEVGVQMLQILWTNLTGSSMNLTLAYKQEKRDFYENGHNLFYKRLKSEKLWKLENQDIIHRLQDCFIRNECLSLILTNLIYNYYSNYNFVNIDNFKVIIDKVGDIPTIQNTEKIINCCNIFFKLEKNEEAKTFIDYIKQLLLQHFSLPHEDTILFKKILYLEILTLARRHEFEVENLEELIEKSLQTIDSLLENDVLRSFNYRSTKIFETFIGRVMFCIAQDMNHLWSKLNKEYAICTLIKIIQKSNLRKPVALSVDILRQFGVKMEEDENDKILKINLINETLLAMHEVPPKQYLKIRRSPESRLVVHAMCSLDRNTNNKFYLNWVLSSLLDLITDPGSSDYSISSALHTIDILISDNRLQHQTLHFIPDIVIQCVELFQRPNWIVRNADLQLAKAIIERIYGVSMNSLNRPKNIEDLFTLFPKLSTYFFKILSSDILEERAVIVLQFFSESQVKKNSSNPQVSEILDYFRILLIHIIKNYENHYGMLAVRSYVSLCLAECIPKVISDITDFIEDNFIKIKKNILSNFIFLLKELLAKYDDSFENYVSERGLKVIHCRLKNFATALQKYDDDLFDILLLKMRSKNRILECLNEDTHLDNSVWLHNNLSFLVINTKSGDVCQILDKVLFIDIPKFMHVKILSILVSKYENGEFSFDDQLNILKVLFTKAIILDELNNYILTSYFKVILVFMQNITDITLDLEIVPAKPKTLYKTMIIVLYVSVNNNVPINIIEGLYPSFEKMYINYISINEEIDNDIASTLIFYYQKVPQKHCLGLSKMVVYFSMYRSTYYEMYYFITAITGKSYMSFLDALQDFLSIDNLREFLGDEDSLKLFFTSVCNYLHKKLVKSNDADDFYAVEGDELIPKKFLCKLLTRIFTKINA